MWISHSERRFPWERREGGERNMPPVCQLLGKNPPAPLLRSAPNALLEERSCGRGSCVLAAAARCLRVPKFLCRERERASLSPVEAHSAVCFVWLVFSPSLPERAARGSARLAGVAAQAARCTLAVAAGECFGWLSESRRCRVKRDVRGKEALRDAKIVALPRKSRLGRECLKTLRRGRLRVRLPGLRVSREKPRALRRRAVRAETRAAIEEAVAQSRRRRC